MKEIRFISREFGTWIYLPIYFADEFVLDINAKTIESKRKKREIELSIDKASPLELELIESTGSDGYSDPVISLNKGYVFASFPDTDFQASFRVYRSSDFQNADLVEDSHIGKIVREKSESVLSPGNSAYDNAHLIYEYVFGIPFTDEKFRGKISGKPYTPTQVIRSNRARKCVCKAELFRDLCVASGIPARTLSAEYYTESDVAKYLNRERRPNKNHSHAFATFYDKGWHLGDPTLGGFDDGFQVPNYYEKIISARGIESIQVSARRI